MELHDAITQRRMTRHFSGEPIAEEVLLRVLEAARFAPSAGFSEGVEFLVLSEASRRARFWELASEKAWRLEAVDAPGLLAAPVIVLPLADPTTYVRRYGLADKAASLLAGLDADAWPVPYWLVDAAFASMLLLLAAEDAGLGGLFFQLHGTTPAILAGLDVPADRLTIGALALGYRADVKPATTRRTRRAREERFHRDTFGSAH